ncbi:hypothetical protein U1Q18_016211 [Sarracenia purpurea var. burkii]
MSLSGEGFGDLGSLAMENWRWFGSRETLSWEVVDACEAGIDGRKVAVADPNVFFIIFHGGGRKRGFQTPGAELKRENRGTSSPESGPVRCPPKFPLPEAERRTAVRGGGDKRRWWSDDASRTALVRLGSGAV